MDEPFHEGQNVYLKEAVMESYRGVLERPDEPFQIEELSPDPPSAVISRLEGAEFTLQGYTFPLMRVPLDHVTPAQTSRDE